MVLNIVFTRAQNSSAYGTCVNIYHAKLTLGSVFLLHSTVVSPMRILDTVYEAQAPELCEVGCKLKIYVPKKLYEMTIYKRFNGVWNSDA